MTAININNAKTYLDVHGASRRVKVSAASPELTLDDAMLPVILRVSKMKSGLEFRLSKVNNFQVFMHGDYMGTFRMFDKTFIISSRNFTRERSAYGLNQNEEASSSERTIAMKMANRWTNLTYNTIRSVGNHYCNRMYSVQTVNYANNKPSSEKISSGVDSWIEKFIGCDYLVPNMYGDNRHDITSMFYNVLYHLFLDALPAKQDLDWDEEPVKPSRIKDIIATMEDTDKLEFIERMDEMHRRVIRRKNIFNTGCFVRVNREGKINILYRIGLAPEKTDSSIPRYDSVDALFAQAPDLKDDFVIGINAMVGAGRYRYVNGVGVRLTDLPDEFINSSDTTDLTGCTMYWVEPGFIKPLTAWITI